MRDHFKQKKVRHTSLLRPFFESEDAKSERLRIERRWRDSFRRRQLQQLQLLALPGSLHRATPLPDAPASAGTKNASLAVAAAEVASLSAHSQGDAASLSVFTCDAGDAASPAGFDGDDDDAAADAAPEQCYDVLADMEIRAPVPLRMLSPRVTSGGHTASHGSATTSKPLPPAAVSDKTKGSAPVAKKCQPMQRTSGGAAAAPSKTVCAQTEVTHAMSSAFPVRRVSRKCDTPLRLARREGWAAAWAVVDSWSAAAKKDAMRQLLVSPLGGGSAT
ncbi:MAG: hypothetical protein EOO41_05440, partial [Methanobacteriota archaeon]